MPLYKYYAERFPTEERYKLATELFYAAHDYVPPNYYREGHDLDDEELKAKGAALVDRMRAVGDW